MEISNKTLAWLVVATIVVSLTGTFLSVGKINGVIGAVTSNTTGNATVTISSQTALAFTVATLDFGSGAVAAGPVYYQCNMSVNKSTSTNTNKAGNCGDTFTNTTNWLQLENTGNTWLNVTLNFSKNAANFIGGTLAGGPLFKYTVSDNETGSCNGINTSLAGWVDVVNNSLTTICNGTIGSALNYTDTQDSLAVGILISIPADAIGTKNVDIIAQGTNN